MKRKVSASLFILFAAVAVVFIFNRAPTENRSEEVEIWPVIKTTIKEMRAFE